MPSHIFTRVGYWRESVAANKASAATDSGAKPQTPHAFDYMVYAYLQLGEDAAAEGVWAEAKSLKLSNAAFSQPFGLAAIPSRLALERGRWAEAAKLELPANVSRRGLEAVSACRIGACIRARSGRGTQR
jgi:hypothetical protein